MEEVSRGPAGPFEDLEVIRIEAGMSTTRFCQVLEMPERTWRRWQAKTRVGGQSTGPWPRPAREGATELVLKHALAHPAWGHRKIWAMVRHDGHVVSEATVLRIVRDEGVSDGLCKGVVSSWRRLTVSMIKQTRIDEEPEARKLGRELFTDEMLDQLMAATDERGLALTGEGGFGPEMIQGRPRAGHGGRADQPLGLREGRPGWEGLG